MERAKNCCLSFFDISRLHLQLASPKARVGSTRRARGRFVRHMARSGAVSVTVPLCRDCCPSGRPTAVWLSTCQILNGGLGRLANRLCTQRVATWKPASPSWPSPGFVARARYLFPGPRRSRGWWSDITKLIFPRSQGRVSSKTISSSRRLTTQVKQPTGVYSPNMNADVDGKIT